MQVIKSECFTDEDTKVLYYSSYLLKEGDLYDMPSWISFNENSKKFLGLLDSDQFVSDCACNTKEIDQDSETSKDNVKCICTYVIRVYATDNLAKSYGDLTINYYNHVPYVNKLINLDDNNVQQPIRVHYKQNWNYVFSKETF